MSIGPAAGRASSCSSPPSPSLASPSSLSPSCPSPLIKWPASLVLPPDECRSTLFISTRPRGRTSNPKSSQKWSLSHPTRRPPFSFFARRSISRQTRNFAMLCSRATNGGCFVLSQWTRLTFFSMHGQSFRESIRVLAEVFFRPLFGSDRSSEPLFLAMTATVGRDMRSVKR